MQKGFDKRQHKRWMSELRPTSSGPSSMPVLLRQARTASPARCGGSWAGLPQSSCMRDMEHNDFQRQMTEAYKDRSARDHDFHLNLLCCIPKKAFRHDESMGPVYKVDGTRPISIADFSNQIIAAAFKHRWEQIRSRWIQTSRGASSLGGACLTTSWSWSAR